MKNRAATKSYQSLNTLKQYITLDTTDYWHIQYPLNNIWKEYYWDMSEKAFGCTLPRDEHGITQYIGEDGDLYYSMIEVAQYAMASYQAYLKTDDEKWFKDSENHARFLIDNKKPYRESSHALVNEYPVSLYDLSGEWVSSLAYGVAISVLLRLYKLTGNERYFEAAGCLGSNYEIDVDKGGIKRPLRSVEGLTIYEEYPSEKVSGVLNGHITALWGLYDLGKFDQTYGKTFEGRINELSNNLKVWDADFWSYYDIKHQVYNENNLASIHYHMLHIRQLLVLYRLSGQAAFANYAEKWIRDKFSILSRLRAFSGKTFYRIKKDLFNA